MLQLDFSTPLSVTDRLNKQKINKDINDINHTVILDLTDTECAIQQ